MRFKTVSSHTVYFLLFSYVYLIKGDFKKKKKQLKNNNIPYLYEVPFFMLKLGAIDQKSNLFLRLMFDNLKLYFSH